MEPEDYIEYIDSVASSLRGALLAQQTAIKTWIGEQIMDLNPAQVDRAMRVIKSIEKMSEQCDTLTTGVDVEEASWKRRILTAARDCGGKISTDRLREWMVANITFTEYELQVVKYGNERTTRWWHSMRPNLTYMTQDGTLERLKHGVYAITPEGESYLDT